MTNHHMHQALARQRDADISANARPRRPVRTVTVADLAPVLSVLVAVAGLFAVASPSL
jgi:hypothetical protein